MKTCPECNRDGVIEKWSDDEQLSSLVTKTTTNTKLASRKTTTPKMAAAKVR